MGLAGHLSFFPRLLEPSFRCPGYDLRECFPGRGRMRCAQVYPASRGAKAPTSEFIPLGLRIIRSLSEGLRSSSARSSAGHPRGLLQPAGLPEWGLPGARRKTRQNPGLSSPPPKTDRSPDPLLVGTRLRLVALFFEAVRG
jgi:hypothetical protein